MKRVFIISIICLSSCIEPYEVEVKDTQKALVIDASLTNLPGRQFVKLEYSFSLLETEPEMASGALVNVVDDLGNNVLFSEVSPGYYMPDSSFVGLVGRKYQLSVQTFDGNEYLSEFEELLEPANIKEIYGRFLSLRSETSDGFDVGVQFLVDIDQVDQENHNYRFEYTEDYEILLPYGSMLEFNPTTRLIDRRNPPLSLCYFKQESQGLIIATAGGQTNGNIREFPLIFIAENQRELIGKYSLTIRPYRISNAAYQYYSDLKENNESAGSFFDRQKGALIGNIRNINDPTAPVLGYFEVAGVSEDYKIFDAGTWQDDGYYPDLFLESCNMRLDTVRTADILAGNFDFNNMYIYNFAPTEAIIVPLGYNVLTLLVPEICGDCRYYGSLKKPAFWD
ncbi:DUF4249 domain-containing protein [Fulvivirga lutimaris]|uniref:DUF4249 domain-containing protein n=1 Tax=Fulvivirga lutimaris TaxID=1819566 RepID=UPI0012BCC817|nr:DUF4249 domain-containing protein [Fulvivirga lutimaris]